MGEQFGNPTRVGFVGLLAWPLPDLLRIAHHDLLCSAIISTTGTTM
jgi:hypothetical protein